MALVNGGFLPCMDMKKFLKNFFLQNRLSDIYYGSGEWGLFALYGHEEILKKLFSPKPLVRF